MKEKPKRKPKTNLTLYKLGNNEYVDQYGRILEERDNELVPTGRCNWYNSIQLQKRKIKK